MIYLDASVTLAQLLAEDRRPPGGLWRDSLVSSRLLEYEVWTRINAKGLARSHGEAVRALLAGVAILEMVPPVLSRALDPFPVPVRTLDALHLASLDFLRNRRQPVALATYDQRLAYAAASLDIPLFDLN